MKRRIHRSSLALAVLIALAFPGWAWGAKLVLKKAFIEKYKNRVTVDVDFLVDKSHKKPNPAKDDGDLHFAGRAQAIGLPLVAEIMNAAQPPQQGAVAVVKQRAQETDKQPVRLAGVWRLWFEHPPKSTKDKKGKKKEGQQVQGKPVPVPENTNPDHVFEIHPVTSIGNLTILQSFRPISGFEAYDARTAFEYYESLKVTVKASQTAVLLSSSQARYNYAEFRIELQGKPVERPDGWMVLATVLDHEGNTIVSEKRRMVFAKGTPPAEIIQTRKKGDQLRVLGIPRVNLERVSHIVKQAGKKQVETKLPYEMIIVGVFPE
jgi:hypothetical protein